MLLIEHPDHCAPETAYVLSAIFDGFLGIPYRSKPIDGDIFRLSAEGGTVSLPSVFFPALAQDDVTALTRTALKSWNSDEMGCDIPLIDPSVPVLFGEPSYRKNDDRIHLGIDVFGAAFFMLSRFEETAWDRHDIHGRFPAKESLAYRHGFLMRPLIDEYVEILWAAMQQLWPSLERKARRFAVIPSHDVDIPYLGLSLESTGLLFQRCAGDMLKRRNPLLAARTLRSYWRARTARDLKASRDAFAGDLYNAFDWFMELSEQAGVQSRFYFMTDREPNHPYGGNYDIDAPHIERLIKDIAARGHEIGIHPTGESYCDRKTMLGQSEHFAHALAACQVEQDRRGGRHHYLRWRADTTPRFWHEAGLSYDSTLGYADHVGFRCGTCHAFPLWDLARRERLDVHEQPLIVMECSLLDSNYMGCDPNEAASIIEQLKKAARLVKGQFVFLWHNSALIRPSDRDLYRVCLDL